ncbi:MAG TPA: pyruvate formate lyase family protein [Deltaproteobacteria bacterium]|nr:pyruvate formate lyase family protein [Deltaproteobacteria bacterium]
MKISGKIIPMNFVTRAALGAFACAFNLSRLSRSCLKNADGWVNFSVGIRTQSGTVAQTLIFNNGRVRVSPGVGAGADVVLNISDEAALRDLASAPPGEVLNMMLRNRLTINGNISYLQLLNYCVSLLVRRPKREKRERASGKAAWGSKAGSRIPNAPCIADDLHDIGGSFSAGSLSLRRMEHLKADNSEDRNVEYLDDPYLSKLDLEDFPRMKLLLHRRRAARPELCAERPKLLTDWYRKNGFEESAPGRPWQPVLRQGLAFEHLMRCKKPVIADAQLLAGTTTANPVCGVIVYPDAQAVSVWGELHSMGERLLNPYDISEETVRVLNDVFPFWLNRSFHQWVNKEFNRPLSLRINERFVAVVCSKAVCVSHTVPGLKNMLEKGTSGLIGHIKHRLDDGSLDDEGRAALEGMIHSLKGLEVYAGNLASEARLQAEKTTDPARRKELLHMADVSERVPRMPAETLDEAVQSIWTTWIGMHMENTNVGLSLGRLDQLLQPYYLADLKKIGAAQEREAYIRHAVELIGCLYLRISDHMPLSPDIGNTLFGTSPSNQAITLGGVTPDGEDGVNDMTYIFLKVTEMLALPDPNINARINIDRNSETYIRRLCEVNFTTSATPSLHNDSSVFASLKQHGYPLEHIRDWSATGCVEPTISGRHNGHTGAVMINLVAAMEMALNNGRHPLMEWDLGPRTGNVEDFTTFEDFFEAFGAQLRFLIEQAVSLNDLYAEAHARLRPTPFISSTIEGCIESARDITRGGARYNTTGTASIGLADVTDSLMTVKKLVFDERAVSFRELKEAVDADFRNNPALRALAQNKVPLFGSGSLEALHMANAVASLIHDTFSSHRNLRGGRYTTGFWSMSQHTAYGNLSGALPSGRLKGKPFTPGLTPEPHASRNYLDFISDVARLRPENMDNNMAFNVRLSPSAQDSREKTIGNMAGYVKAYCRLGGMQMQFNVVDSRTLRDAMANPENYRDLIVRISGYNAYFVSLNTQQQLELIERAEYGV